MLPLFSSAQHDAVSRRPVGFDSPGRRRPCASRITISLVVAVCLSLAMLGLSGCTRAGGAASVPANVDPAAVSPAHERAEQLQRLYSAGDYSQLAIEAPRAAEAFPTDARLQRFAAETLLSLSQLNAAEGTALESARLATAASDPTAAAAALKLWATTRLRAGLPLDFSQLDLPIPEDSALDVARSWSDALAGAVPYQIERPNGAIELPLADAPAASQAAELLAVTGHAGGTPLARIFIDTGAQHTIITHAAAEAAGVRLGPGATELTGFASTAAQAGVLDRLQLGVLTLRNVPVLVADSPALVAAEGQMSLGTDLLYHLPLTLDYPARRVTAPLRGELPSPDGTSAAELWAIPLWTFSHLALAEGRTSSGAPARILVDTGDRSGTFLSYRWACRNLPELAGVHSGMVFRFKKRNLTLAPLELGDRILAGWPVVDTLPVELDRLDVVDVMLGHDLLKRYRVTIDLAGRQLLLAASDAQPIARTIEPQPDENADYDLP